MKKLQALFNENTNKIIKQATKEKSAIKNLNFLFYLAMVTNDTKPNLKNPQHSMKIVIIPTKTLAKQGKKQFTRNCQHKQATSMVHDTYKSYAPYCSCIKNKWVFKIKYNCVYLVSTFATTTL